MQGCTAGTWERPGFEPVSVCLGLVPHRAKVINRSADTMDFCFPAPGGPFLGIQKSGRFRGTDGEVQESGRVLSKVVLEYICVLFQTPHSGQAMLSLRPWFWLQLHCRLTLVLGQMAFPGVSVSRSV